MRNVFTLLILSSTLVACSSGSSRYRDTTQLEKPPTLALQKTPNNAVIDDSAEPKKQLGGLDEKVELLDESPKKIVLKQPVMEAWRTVAAALRQSDIKLTDYDKNKHQFYVGYKSQGGLNGLIGLLDKDATEIIYLLTLEPKDGETLITGMLASHHEQQIADNDNKDGFYQSSDEDSDSLIEHLFHLLRDDVKTE